MASLAATSLFAAQPVVSGAQGFGALARGGEGGRVLMVTRLDDNPRRPQQGMLRWALEQRGPRIVKFAIAGTIQLEDEVLVRRPFLTVDGSDAPGMGVCIAGGCLKISGTHDVIIRHVRIRLGDETTLRRNKEDKLKRPRNSDGLDCITLEDSDQILIDHCSVSWSCDEIIGITRCRNVTVQWCILSEPLGNPKLHPYGDDHAFPLNASASTLSVHHCLFAHFVMRGPQFECNDLGKHDDYTVKMEAVNNVVFDYERSGARYMCGVEKGQGQSKGRSFQFQFLNNLFLNKDATKPEIEVITKHGYVNGIQVCVSGNEADSRWWSASARVRDEADALNHTSTSGRIVDVVHAFCTDAKHCLLKDHSELNAQLSSERLFRAPVNVPREKTREASSRVLAEAGCSLNRDEVDQRIIRDVAEMRCGKIIASQSKVGGWPKLSQFHRLAQH